MSDWSRSPRARDLSALRRCRYGCQYAPAYASSYCIDTQYRQAQAEFCGHFKRIRFRLWQIPAATEYVVGCFCSFQRALAGVAGCAGRGLIVGCWCLGTSRPAGRHCPSFDSLPLARAAEAGPHLNHQRKETTAAARRSARGVPQAGLRGWIVSRIRPMEQAARPLLPGGRTTTSPASICRSPMVAAHGKSARASRCSLTARGARASGCERTAEDACGALRRPFASTGRLPPAQRCAPRMYARGDVAHRFPRSTPSCSARSPHGSGRSTPSRAASLSRLAATLVEAFPL